MSTKDLDEMVDETGAKIEALFSDMLTPKQRAIYYDILTLTIYQMQTVQSEHSINQALDALGRCRAVLEYGDKIIMPIKPIFDDSIFGAN